MKHLFSIFIALILCGVHVKAQCYEWKDAWIHGGSGAEFSFDLAVSNSDAHYICGEFRDTLTLGAFTIYPDDQNGSSPLLFKTDALGNVQWTFTPEYTSVSPTYDHFNAVDIDSTGNLYVSGAIDNSSVIIGQDTIAAQGRDGILIKFDSLGNVIWTFKVGGSSGDVINDMVLDHDGNILMTGYYTGTISLDTFQLSSAGLRDNFIMKMNPSGQVLWARSAGSTYYDLPTSIAVDGQGNSVFTGYFQNTLYFGNDSLVNPNAYYYPFIIKLNSQGDFLWGRMGESGSSVYTSFSAFDIQGNVWFCAEYKDSIHFGSQALYPSGSSDAFIVKYDPAGNLVWNISFGSSSSDFPRAFLPGPDSTMWFSWNPGSFTIASGRVHYDLLSPSGQSLGNWSGGGGGTAAVISMAYTSDSLICGLGNVNPSSGYTHLAFDNDSSEFEGLNDMFVVLFGERKLNAGIQPPALTEFCAGDSISLMAQTAANLNYQWFMNGAPIPGATDSILDVGSGGTYMLKITEGQCQGYSDTIGITVHSLPTPIIVQQGDTLFSTLPGSAFAWYFNGSVLPGATDSSYVVTQSGDYFFLMTDGNGCTGNSDTVHIELTGLDLSNDLHFSIYPQPAKDHVYIEFAAEEQAEIALYDLRGAQVLEKQDFEFPGRIELNTRGLTEGIYILRINMGGRLYSRRLILTNQP